MHKTVVGPLSLIYAGLIVYASLYPFSGWRDQDVGVIAFLFAPWPRYWSVFDVVINLLGYIPLGALFAMHVLCTRHWRKAWWISAFMGALLSFVMEGTQSFLTSRVASREDWLLNSVGAAIGAYCVVLMLKQGWIEEWAKLRLRWFVPDARGAAVLLLTWPVALFFPPAVPFGLGQVGERIWQALLDWQARIDFLQWLSIPAQELQPMEPLALAVCVFLGLLIPCVLGCSVLRRLEHRLFFVPFFFALGVGVTGLSSALSWGPAHIWSWLELPVQIGLLAAMLAALGMGFLPVRLHGMAMLCALLVYLLVLNQASESPYYVQTLQQWEQGRFMRFNGLAQWVGWLWPYAALVYLVKRVK
jgi:VanZ family protein